MKKFYAILCITIASLIQLQAQAPQGFNYQATVRNSSGDLIVNTFVYFKFNIMQGSQTSVPVYSETHYAPTDDLGQISLVIGQGTPTTGTFSALDWSLGSYYLGIELDTGSGYVAMGTTQLLSVPYALYAESSGSSSSGFPSGGTEGQVLSIVSGVPTWTDLSGSTDSENLAEITTVEASDIDFESMTAGGNINDDGGFTIVSKGVVWSESPDPTPELETKTDEGGGASNFTSTINGLSEETEYFYRAYATNSLGTSYGNTFTITTDSSQFYDQDGDGYTPSEGDCDDFDSFTYPGAAFNESSTECMTDVDEDGYGAITAINPGTDCDDSNTFINPGATEVIDGIDNNCDGYVDICDLDLSGLYSVVTTYWFHDFITTIGDTFIIDEVEITAVGDGTFSIPDFSGGLWPGAYNDAYGPYPNGGNFPLVFSEVCGEVMWSGQTEVYGNVLMQSEIFVDYGPNNVNPETGVITISFYCEAYGEYATSVYTPL